MRTGEASPVIRRRSVALRVAVCVAALGAALAPGAGRAAAACANDAALPGGVHPGGEWRTYGHDFSNTRNQDQETSIGPAQARSLAPAWTFTSSGAGDFTGTPSVADGCVYVGSNGGYVFALNADTGLQVWKTQVPAGGGINSSVSVVGGVVYAEVSHATHAPCVGSQCQGPYVIALDQATGALKWTSSCAGGLCGQPVTTTVNVIDVQPGADVYGSPIVFDGLVIAGVSGGSAELGDEADRYAFQGSLVILEAATGAVVRKTWTIHAPPNAPGDNYAGAGIWSTPAIDPAAKLAYVGTANPFRPQAEHANANSVLKVDVDKTSPTFGAILDHYKGTPDEYVPGFSKLPCYDIPGNPPPYYPQGLGSCGDIDLDFGAAPNLFTVKGVPFVGDGQKSGIYHAFDAATMGKQKTWSTLVGPPTSVGGIIGSTAFDGSSIYGPITAPGYLWSIGKDAGRVRWVAPVADAVHWGPPVAYANGVVYTADFKGVLDAFDAKTGLPIVARPFWLGSQAKPPAVSWGGISVARNAVYASVGTSATGGDGYVVAFRPGGGGPGVPGLPNLPKLGGGLVVLAGPGTVESTYYTPLMIVRAGAEKLTFLNLDVAPHDVDQKVGAGQTQLFESDVIGTGQTTEVRFHGHLQSGKTYDFYCTVHPGMFGKLVAV